MLTRAVPSCSSTPDLTLSSGMVCGEPEVRAAEGSITALGRPLAQRSNSLRTTSGKLCLHLKCLKLSLSSWMMSEDKVLWPLCSYKLRIHVLVYIYCMSDFHLIQNYIYVMNWCVVCVHSSGQMVTKSACYKDLRVQVNTSYCNSRTRPSTGVVSCNTQPCPAR